MMMNAVLGFSDHEMGKRVSWRGGVGTALAVHDSRFPKRQLSTLEL
jgi:hypothetical protein